MQVRCRTPEELQEGISCGESREREQRFFSEHPELKHVGEEFKGIPALSRKLVQIQDQCIQSHLPTLQKEVTPEVKLLSWSAAVILSSVPARYSCRCMCGGVPRYAYAAPSFI